MNIEQNLIDIKTELKGIKEGLDILLEKKKSSDSVYTNEELYRLKYEGSLTWKALSSRTGIPVSTLQSRVRNYKYEIIRQIED